MIRAAVTIALSLALVGASDAHALTLQQVSGGTFDQPTYLTSDPGNPNRLFVVEQEGKIVLIENGVRSEFADLSPEIGCAGDCVGERGLMSIALAPDFDESGRLYVDYANNADGTIHVDELVAEEPGHEFADISTLEPLLTIPHPIKSNHNGGQLQFGPDGDLYISTGDGGGSNDELQNSQDLTKLLGKILRIRPDPEGSEPFYTVPPDNPFPGATPPANTIWSYGLRNPFRFSFDRLTGDMVIADVGQGKSEEIDFAPSPFPGTVGGAGVDYGWNCREGFLVGPGVPDPQCATPPTAGFANPVFDYPHTPDPELGGPVTRCAIIGGYVVRDPDLGALYGHYLYADLCSGAIRSLQLPASSAGSATDDCWTGLDVSHPVSFGEDSAGRVYVVAEGGGVYRIAGLPSATCPTPPPPPTTESESPHLSIPFVGIEPQRRRVERGKVALLTVWVSPCDKRKGQPVILLRDGHANGSKFLSRACTARFLPRVRRTTTFTAAVPEDSEYLPAESRHLKIRIEHRHRR